VPATARTSSRPLLRSLLWTLLGAWLGAMALFGAVLARVVFEVVPSLETAGLLVGRVLGPLQLGGAVAGVALSALGGALGRRRIAVVLPLLLSAVCLVNHFGVSPAVAAIHLEDPSAGPGAAARFAMLHRLSVGLFSLTVVGVLGLAALHAAWELREERSKSS
jgi:hypothetical protein